MCSYVVAVVYIMQSSFCSIIKVLSEEMLNFFSCSKFIHQFTFIFVAMHIRIFVTVIY